MADDNKSFISKKYPTYRDDPDKSVYKWLDGKRVDDGAEGLWRIHDHLYDLTDFVDRHPGGEEWLRVTKGTDITEAFETHHITTSAELLLPNFAVRPAKGPRNIQLTFHEDGFYKTLKRKVRKELLTIDKSKNRSSKLIIDGLLTSTFILAILTIKYTNLYLAFLAGLALTWTTIAAHNFFHQKDNWRMAIWNISLLSYREWRISHAMSHHLYANSLHDLEISFFEPFLCWLPNPNIKNSLQRYGSWIYGPVIYVVLYKAQFLRRVIMNFKNGNQLFKDDVIAFSLPLVMYYFGDLDMWTTFKYWLLIISISSFLFGLIGLNAAHHHEEIAHDGDIIPKNMDFGLYQLKTVMDRSDTKGHLFLTLTHFGDHGLHHLFPTVDHAILPLLYPTFYETCKEFEAVLREGPWYEHIMGQHKQLARIATNDLTKTK